MNNTERIEFNKVRDFSGYFNASFDFIRSEFKSLAKYLFIGIIPFILINTLYLRYYMELVTGVSLNGSNPVFTNSIFQAYINMFIMYFIMGMTLATVQTISYLYIKHYRLNDGTNVGDYLKDQFGLRFIKILLLTISYGVIVTIGSFIVVLPGIYFSIALILAGPVMIFEDKSIFNSLSRSLKLTKNNWWNTLGNLLVMALLIGILNFVFSIAGSFFSMANILSGVESESMGLLSYLGSFLQSLSLLFYPIYVIFLSFIYFSYLEEKEAPTLMEKIENLDSE